ncbi:M28 family peptidase [Muricoccus aerilatus]|uniref:M28 family peptidase n=1 Tax=Muricoccus aerilatus TaxID=452982 RepID=UPI0005C12BD1|nr:M28 family peptidase [Roseomonas aerilata]
MRTFLGRLAADPGLRADFEALCDFGGRVQGSASAEAAFAWTLARLRETGPTVEEPVPYSGWALRRAALSLLDGTALPHVPLFGSGNTGPDGVELEVIDLGRGAPDDIAAAGEAVRGKAVLLRHEYPFAPWTIHRRFKLAAAAAAGAAAALMVQPEPGIGPVSGGANGVPIPCFGVGIEVASRLAGRRARLLLEGEAAPAMAPTLVLDLPGGGEGRVVLSAHLDGHPLGESAMDNATGLAAVLALARAVAPDLLSCRRGLAVCVFGAEEWALSGSKAWLASIDPARRFAIRFNLNLDSIAGHPRLTALTSGFTALGPFVRQAAAAIGAEVAVHLPLMVNSDHANFAAAGIPALRLIAGFDVPEGALRHLLTGADTRAVVPPGELKSATITAGAILWAALNASDEEIAALA